MYIIWVVRLGNHYQWLPSTSNSLWLPMRCCRHNLPECGMSKISRIGDTAQCVCITHTHCTVSQVWKILLTPHSVKLYPQHVVGYHNPVGGNQWQWVSIRNVSLAQHIPPFDSPLSTLPKLVLLCVNAEGSILNSPKLLLLTGRATAQTCTSTLILISSVRILGTKSSRAQRLSRLLLQINCFQLEICTHAFHVLLIGACDIRDSKTPQWNRKYRTLLH